MKQRVYIETSVVSYLTGRPSRDMVVAAHQELTREWWQKRASAFEVFVSALVLEESSGGDSDASRRRVSAISDIAILEINEAAVELAEKLVSQGPIPQQAAADALHIAIAAMNGTDYLLTWNCKHLANAVHRHEIETLVEESGLACPVICTPEELMEE